MAKTRRTAFNDYESAKPNGDDGRFIRLSNSQMLHYAMLTLPHSAFKVYSYMKLESGGKREFEFPLSKFKKVISPHGFQNAVEVLVKSGFIEVTEKNANIRKPNKYRFTTGWKSLEKP